MDAFLTLVKEKEFSATTTENILDYQTQFENDQHKIGDPTLLPIFRPCRLPVSELVPDGPDATKTSSRKPHLINNARKNISIF